ncbi:hypothetical protein JW865_08360 [Candidatus Bathyarchaeota archaeon]|nr:hypothetical protein [Candidatus Bathyarchaeota archaeon]
MPFLYKARSEEEINAIIERTAEAVLKYDLVEPAVLFFESVKPLSFMGGKMAATGLAFLIPLIGYSIDDFFVVFQETANIEKLLNIIETRKMAELEKKRKEKAAKKQKKIKK